MPGQWCECEDASHTYLSPNRFASSFDHGTRASVADGEQLIAREGSDPAVMICESCREAGHL